MAKRLGKPLMPWQQYAVDVALEYDPDTGELWYEEVDITVPRQSGKTTLILALFVWRCVYMAQRLNDAQTCTYLAQSGKMARKKLEREFIPILRRSRGLREVPHSRARPQKATDWKPSMNNGSEHVLFGTGSYLQIEAPTATGSHGDVLDMPVIDEAFAHEGDLVEQAVDAASVTRTSPQLYVVSTAGNERSPYLWRKVLAGRYAVQAGVESRICYLEWSLPEDAAFDDEEAWAEYLPALGHTITLARLRAKLEKALRNPDAVDEDGDDPGLAGFRRGYLNQWVKVPQLDGASKPAEISDTEWSVLSDPRSQIVGTYALGVGVGHDGATASVAVAGLTASGRIQIELAECAPSTWWVERRLLDATGGSNRPARVGWNHGGPARAMSPELLRGSRSVPVEKLSGRDWSAACEAFRAAVRSKRIVHLDDPMFLDAIHGADRREVGTGWEWDERGARTDITPILAATAAVRALELSMAGPPPKSKVMRTRASVNAGI